MLLFHLTNGLRSFLYMWLGVELAILWFVYSFGYRRYKKTPIISALQSMIFFLALQYTVISMLPILFSVNKDVHKIAVNFVIPLSVFGIYYVRRFRNESLWEDKMKTPDADSVSDVVDHKGGDKNDKKTKRSNKG